MQETAPQASGTPVGEPPGALPAKSPDSAPKTAETSGARAEVAFPPPKFEPLHARTAQVGDGAWTAVDHAARGEAPLMYRSIAHPHRIKGFSYVVIVAIDMTRVDLRLVAGTLEPESKTVPEERRPGLIPPADHADLIAVFNGGFMAKHGRFGMMLAGDTFLPPREDACTVALYRDRSIRIEKWTDLKATEPEMTGYRQAAPCIIERGVLHPELETDRRPRPWGSSETGETEIRRSALGLDASGRILFYGSGDWITVKALADSMKAAGAVNASQLDINWSYTRFLFFGRPSADEPLQVVSTLIPKTKHTSQGYVAKASERDFFYLKRRSPTPRP